MLYFLFDVGSLDILWSLILIYLKIDKVSKFFIYLFFLSVNLVFESPAQSAFAYASSIGLHFAPIIKLKFFVVFKYLMVLLTPFQSFSLGVLFLLLKIFAVADISSFVIVAMYCSGLTSPL